MQRSLLFVVCAACASPLAPSAPPGVAPALAMSPAVAGEDVVVRIEQLDPGERVYLLAGDFPGLGDCYPILGNQCVGIEGNVGLLISFTADGNGVATGLLPVPPNIQGIAGKSFQAAAVRGPGGSASVLSDVVSVEPINPFQDVVYDAVSVDPSTVSSIMRLPQRLDRFGYQGGQITSVSGQVLDRITLTPVPGLSIEYDNDTAYDLVVDLDQLDPATLNPITFELDMVIEVHGVEVPHHMTWTLGLAPDRVGLMWVTDRLYAKTLAELPFSSFNAISFAGADYAPVAEHAPGVWQFTGNRTLPDFDSLDAIYVSQGFTYVTDFNEAAYFNFGNTTQVANGEHRPMQGARWGPGFGGDVWWIDAVDRTGDGIVDWQDLEAFNLETAIVP